MRKVIILHFLILIPPPCLYNCITITAMLAAKLSKKCEGNLAGSAQLISHISY